MNLDKQQKQELKEKIESLGLEVANMKYVWSNGNKMRLYKGQDKHPYRNEENDRKMIAVLIEIT